MNIVLLITVTLALTLTHANGQNSEPCQENTDTSANAGFVWQHHLTKDFDFNSMVKWTKYLKGIGLCGRPTTGTQSFIKVSGQGAVERICNGDGKQVNGNLCISNSNMSVHDIEVHLDCKVTKHVETRKPVIVACDKIGDSCLPVRFDRYIGQKPASNTKVCEP